MATVTDENVLVAYVDGSDLRDVAPLLRDRFRQFITGRAWVTDQVLFVDQVHDPDPSYPDYLPDWDLGLNIGLDHVPVRPAWFADVRALVEFLTTLQVESGRHFMVCLASRSRHWFQEHLVVVDGDAIDFAWLQEMIQRQIGRGP